MMAHLRRMAFNALFLCCVFWVSYSSSNAQECGDLTEKSCGYVAAAISNWNTLFSSTARIQKWSYTRTESANADSLISILDQSGGQRVASIDAEGNVSIVPLSGELREQWRNAEFEHLERMLGDDSTTVHLVDMNWSLSDEDFSSTVIVNDRYPYLHGRILSSIVLESDSNSCVYKRLLWLWDLTRGEISIDLRPYGEDFRCARASEAWMYFGDARAEMSEIEYNDNSCRSTYAWAYATPFATLAFDVEFFSFTVGGLGSKGTGAGDCVESRQ